jgi:hypothetical protein
MRFEDDDEGARRGPGYWAVRVLSALVILLVIVVALSARSRGRQAPHTRLFSVTATNFRYHGFSSTVRPGLFQVSFTNAEGFPFRHELVLVALQPGQNAQTIVDDAKAKGPDSEDDFLHFGEIADVDTGSTMVGTFDLPPGTYALACWENGQPGGGEGQVHAARGMVFPFTVR